MTAPKVQADFDRIALLTRDGWDHNAQYHRFLLRHVPDPCGMALDVGCGTGAFSRLLADRAERVVALDLSPRMIEIAESRSRAHSNIDYQVVDVTEWEFPIAAFDYVVSIATMHHLPMEEMLLKAKHALRGGGTLAILDLYESVGLADLFLHIVATPLSLMLMLAKTGRLRDPLKVRQAWEEHGRNDVYPTLAEVRRVCERVLPGAEVRQHLFWRYSVIWRQG